MPAVMNKDVWVLKPEQVDIMRRRLLSIPQGIAAAGAITAFGIAGIKSVIIGGGAMYLWGLREPSDMDILLPESVIRLGGSLYDYDCDKLLLDIFSASTKKNTNHLVLLGV